MTDTTVAPNARVTAKDKGKHVAVVFFHGMGQQRRYESVSMLVEMLGAHRREKDPKDVRKWQSKLRRERVVDADPDADCACIQVDYDGERVRFYEAYWAPAAAQGTSATSVFWWLIRQVERPARVLIGPWRSFSRIRRADLLSLRSYSAGANPDEDDLYSKLSLAYDHFVQCGESHRQSFDEFLDYLRGLFEDDDSRDRVLNLANDWHAKSQRAERRRLGVLVAVVMTIASAVALLVVAGFWLLGWAATWITALPAPLRAALAPSVELKFANVVALLTTVAWLAGVTGFLKDSVGDVQQFVTYQETEPLHERREKIISAAESTLRHVLDDSDTERVVLVAHSLGTAVALDTLLRLRGTNQANGPDASDETLMKAPEKLNLVHHFVTCGSPIDKINYFFATFRSSDYSYEHLMDWLRGDLGDVPFCTSAQPYVHWLNFWDRGDLISGALETVASPKAPLQRVDNVRIATYTLPDPVASHGAYFSDPLFKSTVFDIVFRNALSFVPDAGGVRPELDWLDKQDVSKKWQSWLMGLCALVPLAALVAAAAAFGLGRFSLALWLLGAVTAVFVGSILLHRYVEWRRSRAARPVPKSV